MVYTEHVAEELAAWQKKMLRRPSLTGRLTAAVQGKINNLIPQKVHRAITAAIKAMIRTVLLGAKYTTASPLYGKSLEERESLVNDRIAVYTKTGAAEGGITGAGGFLASLADFPLLLGIKMKLLFDIAAMYGFDVKAYSERLYILYIFQLAFSDDKERRKAYLLIANWKNEAPNLPQNIHDFDWQTLQQQYRDYIDLAKLAQMLPFIGAAVGAIANYKLIKKLGFTAMQAYRMRILEQQPAFLEKA